MFKQKYIITVESERPPQLFLGDTIGGAKIISLKREEYPDLVDTAWLIKRFPMSRKTIIEKIGCFNVGTAGKHLYDPHKVIPVLKADLSTRRGRPRKN
jgi:hypothetical protein